MSKQPNSNNSSKRGKYTPKEKYTGVWNGKEVSFTRNFATHRFTDEECERLLAGEEIEIKGLRRKNGKTYSVKGKLEQQTYEGHDYVGFKGSEFTVDKRKDTDKQPEKDGGERGVNAGAFESPMRFSYQDATGVADVSRSRSQRNGLESQCLDMGVDASDLEPQPVRFTGNGSGSKVKRAVGAVAKGTAVAAGVGVLGIMAGTTALAAKGKSMKDELVVSVGESMSYYIARLLGGNDHMGVQRFQQAGMKGVEMVAGEKAVRKVARPLPTINMPVVSDNDLSY